MTKTPRIVFMVKPLVDELSFTFRVYSSSSAIHGGYRSANVSLPHLFSMRDIGAKRVLVRLAFCYWDFLIRVLIHIGLS